MEVDEDEADVEEIGDSKDHGDSVACSDAEACELEDVGDTSMSTRKQNSSSESESTSSILNLLLFRRGDVDSAGIPVEDGSAGISVEDGSAGTSVDESDVVKPTSSRNSA